MPAQQIPRDDHGLIDPSGEGFGLHPILNPENTLLAELAEGAGFGGVVRDQAGLFPEF
jgi:hypothetical protein